MNERDGQVQVFVTLDRAPNAATVQVTYRTETVTAAQGADYVSASGTLLFTGAETRKAITVQLVNDGNPEAVESFRVRLVSASGANLGASVTTVEIHDDDESTAGFDPAAYAANEADGSVRLTVRLDVPPGQTASVGYATQDGGAEAGVDYEAASGTLQFLAHETAKTFTVAVIGNSFYTGPRSFTVVLRTPQGLKLGAASVATVTIEDDEAPALAAFERADYAVFEDAGEAVLTVMLSAAPGRPVYVDYATQDGTAAVGDDYTASSGTLEFPAEATTRTVRVAVRDNKLYQGDRAFSVVLSNPQGCALGTVSEATVTIREDDAAPQVNLGQATYTVPETQGVLDVPVRLSRATTRTAQVDYATVNNTAEGGEDYTFASGTIAFEPGETEHVIAITIRDDAVYEDPESFRIELSNPVHASLGGTATALVFIEDDEVLPVAGFSASPYECGESAAQAEVMLELDVAPTVEAFVDCVTEDGSARAGRDYVATEQTVRFGPGQTEAVIVVPLLIDFLRESDEYFSVAMQNPQGLAIGIAAVATVILKDDDVDPAPDQSYDYSVAADHLTEASVETACSPDGAAAVQIPSLAAREYYLVHTQFVRSPLWGQEDLADLDDVNMGLSVYGYPTCAKPPAYVPVIDYADLGEAPAYPFIGQKIPGDTAGGAPVWLVDVTPDGRVAPALTSVDFRAFASVNWPRKRYGEAIAAMRAEQANWTLSGAIADANPVYAGVIAVTGDVYHAGETLTIANGSVVVTTARESDDRAYPGFSDYIYGPALQLAGALTFEGTAQNPVIFTSDAQTPAGNDWQGVFLNADASYQSGPCIIEYARHGIHCDAPGATVERHIVRYTYGAYAGSQDRGTGLYLAGDNPAARDNELHGHADGLALHGANAWADGNRIYCGNCDGPAADVFTRGLAAAGDGALVENNVVRGCSLGVLLAGAAADTARAERNAVLMNEAGFLVGLAPGLAPGAVLTGNTLWANTAGWVDNPEMNPAHFVQGTSAAGYVIVPRYDAVNIFPETPDAYNVAIPDLAQP